MPAKPSYRPWRTALGMLLPLSLGLGFFVAGIGTTMWAPVTSWAAGPFCSGKVIDDSDYYTTPSGGSGVHRHIVCVTGEGKEETRDDITFDGIAIAFPLYSALIFAALLIFAAPRMRRKAEARDTWSSFGDFTAGNDGTPQDLQNMAGLIAAAMRQGNVTVGTMTMDSPPHGTLAARLAELQQLHESGLISDADYEAKKADILSGL
ncbi:MAG: SHOCT domain-containing protein [Sphingomonas sp.]|jgi:hypothetical protein|uniref:SHOCT domain-containing protein n=1 Tax=Sphingomonas sp. TaxID=28214 RepID=UPI003565595C